MSISDSNAISDTNTLHGGALIIFLEEISKSNNGIKYSIDFCDTKSKYKFKFSHENSDQKERIVGLYIKHSQKRISPWRYTFTRDNQKEINDLEKDCDKTFILLITNQEGVALLNQDLYKQLLDESIDDSEWISISRKHNENFRIWSKDRPKKDTLAKNCFPNEIVEYLNIHNIKQKSELKQRFNFFNSR